MAPLRRRLHQARLRLRSPDQHRAGLFGLDTWCHTYVLCCLTYTPTEMQRRGHLTDQRLMEWQTLGTSFQEPRTGGITILLRRRDTLLRRRGDTEGQGTEVGQSQAGVLL